MNSARIDEKQKASLNSSHDIEATIKKYFTHQRPTYDASPD